MQASSSQRSETRRFDPEDGQLRTLDELKKLCIGLYSEQEVTDYWEHVCRPLDESSAEEAFSRDGAFSREGALSGALSREGGHSHEGALSREGVPSREAFLREGPQSREGACPVHGLSREPSLLTRRLSHGEIPFRPQSLPPPAPPCDEAEERMGATPTITPHEARSPMQQARPPDAQDDPFLTSHVESSGGGSGSGQAGQVEGRVRLDGNSDRWRQVIDASSWEQRSWEDELALVFGDGDFERKTAMRRVLVLVPWSVFTITLLLWLLLQHRSEELCILIVVIFFIAALAMLGLWWGGKRCGPLSLLPLGLLCLAAVAMGTGVGEYGWDRYWRQFWWLQTGRRWEYTSATTPAAARLDAAIIGFWDAGSNKTVDGTAIDYDRAAGYRNGRYFCVAPILNPALAGAGLARVNYWAIGLDCCQHLGSFACDDARMDTSGYGVVMVELGFPCPGCNAAEFRAAVTKAERMHGLVSSADAIFVQWVRDPQAILASTFWQALFFVVLSMLLSFILFLVLGSVLWYYGIGQGPMSAGALGTVWQSYKSKQVV
mmetsp:Transcript_4504/g.10624  ORF Transcript_4504/g.10624 Transcript_4504/m.10624 type:complete len:547 (+) Transcript_4504:94-1734(+)